ncbi:MAG: hypothetical protein JWM21_3677 [Acidobacteria bacterium]|nr:hypothetical protein [Acidobacteriota bacterium]
MRDPAIKKSQLAAAVHNDEAVDQLEGNSISFKRLFHGWLSEVPARHERQRTDIDHDAGIRRISPAAQSPARVRQISKGTSTVSKSTQKWRVLTIRELLGLTRATVRESQEHRTWPPEVVLKFMAAEVVTRKDQRR